MRFTKHLSFLLFFLTVVSANAQNVNNNGNGGANGNAHWKVNGNQADSNKFMGTINDADLILKSNNQEVIRLKANDGSTIVNGDLILDKEKNPNGGTQLKYGVFNPQGKLLGVDQSLFLTELFTQEHCLPFTDANGQVMAYTAPIWTSAADQQSGILYSGTTCPVRVGLGTASPLATFDVQNAFQRNYFKIGAGTNFANALRYTTDDRLIFKNRAALYAKGGIMNYTGNVFEDNSGDLRVASAGRAFKLSMAAEGIFMTPTDYASPSQNLQWLGTEQQIYFGFNRNSNGMIGQGNYFGIGIGTTAIPEDFRLAVKGKAIFEEVHVKLNGDWPDYVFEPNYPLMPLDSVQKFIQQNGHLPNIPSATEMENNSVDVAMMQKVYLEKIEELTLYTIDQDERIKQLETQLEELKALVLSQTKK